MTANLIQPVIEQLRMAEALRVASGRSDGELLEEYLRHRQEAALEALVRRHGPMVWGVCRRALNCHHDAEDAFQATFLVLVRKAASVRPREQVGPWLFGVARQTARKARAAAAKRRSREQPEGLEPAAAEPNEIAAVIDEQLSRLPWKYRAAIVLCDLEGKTRQEAARQLGVPEGTVAGRLARARTLLGRLLSRRGVGSAAGILAPITIPAPLVAQTIQAAMLYAASPAAAGAIAPPVLALTQGVLNAMYLSHAKVIACALLAVAVTVGGASWGLYAMQAGAPPTADKPAGLAPAEEPKEKAKVDLPKGLAPVQVLASVDKDGKLVIKTRPAIENIAFGGGAIIIGGAPGAPPPALPPGGAPAPPPGVPGIVVGAAALPTENKVQTETFDFADIEVYDTDLKKLDAKDVAKRLKEETAALAALGEKPDPLHLRLIKPGTLLFKLPAPKAPGGGIGLGGGIAPPGGPPE